MRKLMVVVVTLAAAATILTSCSGGDAGSSGTGGSSGSGGSGATTTIDVTLKNGTVKPNGERLKAKVGSPITLRIDADKAGEIHVHSTPEQHIEFPRGTSTRKLTIKQPGIVDVEDHALDKVIVQLQVS